MMLQVEKTKGEDKSKGHVEGKLANGISLGTNYRVYDVEKVQTMTGEIVQLVHLRAGDTTSYIGSWSPGSQEWQEVDSQEMDRMGARRSPVPGMEGEFWMPYMDRARQRRCLLYQMRDRLSRRTMQVGRSSRGLSHRFRLRGQ